jgi:drug/metabolite transporter (DMT)-like permease
LFNAPRPRWLHGAALVLAMVGLGFLVGLAGEGWQGGLGVGDGLTFLCAVANAFHIQLVARVAPGQDPMGLNTLQIGSAAVANTVAALALAPVPQWSQIPGATWGQLLFLAVFSSVFAFGVQVSAQQVLSPSTASTLMLMESPVGAAAGVFFQGDQFGLPQGVGGVLMMGGAWLSVRADRDLPDTTRVASEPES